MHRTIISERNYLCIKIIIILLSIFSTNAKEDSKHWHRVAEEELKDSLAYKWNTNNAKNVIIFIGDGMSGNTITAGRIYKNGETGYLSWEKFPHVGLLKTYNTNKQVPDSASTATALFSGVKTNFKVIGVDVNVPLADCEASLNTDFHVESIITWAQAVGKRTGFVTTTRVTHATPAPLYAHCPDRKWECEATKPPGAEKCQDIARQLIENEPGKNIKVIMGGGRQMLRSFVNGTMNDPIDKWACYSKDGRDLIEKWKKDKKSRNVAFKFVENNEQLLDVNYKETEFLLGIFANGHISMDWQRDKGPKGQPSLLEMTTAAIKVLENGDDGFLLVVEGGLIDFAHHRGHAAQALIETVRLSEAIEETLKLIDTSETLVIVTSDHTHSLSFNGYGDRGSSILGVAQKSKYDNRNYTTLTYSTGGINNMGYTIDNGKIARIDPSLNDTTDYNYSQQAAIITDEAYHGGADVAVYAKGDLYYY